MRASGINRTATSAGVRTAEFRAQPQRNRYAHGLVVIIIIIFKLLFSVVLDPED